MSHYLYKHYSHDGELLYVGISNSVPARTSAHRLGSDCFDLIKTIEIQKFKTRREAAKTEKAVILLAQPKYNINLKKPPPEKKVRGPARNKRFELRLSEQELHALNRLSEKAVSDRSKLLAGMIRRAAKREKVWPS